MKLSGKLAAAFIEEDNPLKSFFRIKPIFTVEQDGPELLQNIEEHYPTQGYIRIVPDKNEVSTFKNRMHQLGSFCMLDLRKNAAESEKIRPNKNHTAAENADANAYIVYSDVIHAPAAGFLTQVLDLVWPEDTDHFSVATDAPCTQTVALRCGGAFSGPWAWRTDELGGIEFSRTDAALWHWEDTDKPAGSCISIDNLTLFVNTALTDAPAAAAPVEAEPVQAQPVQEPVAAQMPVPAPAAQTVSEPVPPLTSHRAINARITMREQAYLAQMGVSARRGRSIYEIINEKWYKSRMDQLGHPVPLTATGAPSQNDPIENAMTAIRAVLSIPDARASLINEMLRNETLHDALSQVFVDRREHDFSRDGMLTELEAERLALANEVDALKRRRETERSNMMDELRTQYAMELSRLEKKKSTLESEIGSLRKTEENARTAANAAVEEMNRVFTNDIDSRLIDMTLRERAQSLIQGMHGEISTAKPRPATTEPTACELISDVRSYFERADFPLTNDEAVNLLACFTLGRCVLLSGPVGSGKRDMVRLLAGALGISVPEYQRFRVTSDMQLAEKLVCDDKITYDDETFSLLMIVGSNEQKEMRPAATSIFASLPRLAGGLRVAMCITDAPDAYPVSANTFDRAYLLRLAPRGADTPWRPAEARPVTYGKCVSLSALERIFAPKNDLPAEMELRMTAIRERLDKLGTPISRRSLDALWCYCSAVLPYMECSPTEILDLALSQRGLPTLLSSMPLEALMELPDIFKGMNRCLKLLDEPLPLPALY